MIPKQGYSRAVVGWCQEQNPTAGANAPLQAGSSLAPVAGIAIRTVRGTPLLLSVEAGTPAAAHGWVWCASDPIAMTWRSPHGLLAATGCTAKVRPLTDAVPVELSRERRRRRLGQEGATRARDADGRAVAGQGGHRGREDRRPGRPPGFASSRSAPSPSPLPRRKRHGCRPAAERGCPTWERPAVSGSSWARQGNHDLVRQLDLGHEVLCHGLKPVPSADPPDRRLAVPRCGMLRTQGRASRYAVRMGMPVRVRRRAFPAAGSPGRYGAFSAISIVPTCTIEARGV